MEVNEFTGASGAKFATAGNWSLAHKPKTNEQAFVPAGKTCEVAAAGECGSLKVRGHLTGGIAELKVGGAEAGPGNVLCDFVGAEGVAWSGALVYAGTFTGVAQTVATGGFSVGALKIGTTSKGKVKLLEALTVTNASTGVLGEGGTGSATLEFNGQVVTAKNVEFRENSTADFTGATFHCSGEGGVFMLSSTGSTYTGLASATVEASERGSGELSPAKQVNGAGKEIGTIIISGFNITLENLTFGILRLENSGCAAGKGCKLKSGSTFTDSTISANGTEGSPARIESSTPGVAATLTMPEQELGAGFLAIKDLTIGTGPWYVPLTHGKNEGGNTVVGTTIKFEAKPSGKKTFEGEGSLKVGVRISTIGTRIAKGTGLLTAGLQMSTAGIKLVRGQGVITAGSRVVAAGIKIAVGTGSISAGVGIASLGTKAAVGTGNLSVGARVATTGSKVIRGAGGLSVGVRIASLGRMTTAGTGGLSVGTFVASAAQKIAVGVASLSVGVRINTMARITVGGVGKLTTGTKLLSFSVNVATGEGSLKTGTLVNTTGQRSTAGQGQLRSGARINTSAKAIKLGVGRLAVGLTVSASGRASHTGVGRLRVGIKISHDSVVEINVKLPVSSVVLGRTVKADIKAHGIDTFVGTYRTSSLIRGRTVTAHMEIRSS